MQETLTQEDASCIRHIVESEVGKKFGVASGTQKGQALGGDFLLDSVRIPSFRR